MPLARTSNDFEHYYELDDFTDPWRQADTVVLQHGHVRNERLWYAWVPPLAGEYKVLRPDLRGFGRSYYPEDKYQFSLNGLADDLKKLFDKLGIGKVHFVGEALGGVVALHFAYLYPEYLKSLVLITTPVSLGRQANAFEKWLDLVAREGVEAGVRASMGYRFDQKRVDPNHLEWLAKEMSKTPEYVEKACLAELHKYDYSDKVSKINVPTLLLAAADASGKLVAAQDALTLYEKLPNSELHIFQSATSLICYTQPAECAELAKSFWHKLESATVSNAV